MSWEFQVGEWVSVNGERLEVRRKVIYDCFPLSQFVRYTLGGPEMKIVLDVTDLRMILFHPADIGDIINSDDDWLLRGRFQLQRPSEELIGEVSLTYYLRDGFFFFREDCEARPGFAFLGLWRGSKISPGDVVRLSPAEPIKECLPPSRSFVS